jgi:hypothetical protein
MLNKVDTRQLNYPKFEKLIHVIPASCKSLFDEVADDMTSAMTESLRLLAADYS